MIARQIVGPSWREVLREGATHVTATYKMADAKEKVKKMAK
jgi:hypothetical protein